MQTFSTSDAKLNIETAYTVQFKVQCSNEVKVHNIQTNKLQTSYKWHKLFIYLFIYNTTVFNSKNPIFVAEVEGAFLTAANDASGENFQVHKRLALHILFKGR